MSTPQTPPNAVRSQRLARGWSQQQLADRAGLSRPGVSAIEAGRLAPSVTTALALSQALGCTVEQLFAPAPAQQPSAAWAIDPPRTDTRYWQARLDDRLLAYPVEDDSPQLDWHDGVARAAELHDVPADLAGRTLVVAGCDPAAGLLAAEYARQFQFRMLVLRRSSRDALELLAAGKVHAAGIHLGGKRRRTDNARVAHSASAKAASSSAWPAGTKGWPSARGCDPPRCPAWCASSAYWVGREEGSGARQWQDEILTGKPAPPRVAFDHRGVAAAVRCGWADVGPCVRLTSEESGLRFLKVSQKDYDLCYASALESDPRLWALIATLRRAVSARDWRSCPAIRPARPVN